MNFGGFGNASKGNARAACKKCGYAGHLTYQCRNFLKVFHTLSNPKHELYFNTKLLLLLPRLTGRSKQRNTT